MLKDAGIIVSLVLASSFWMESLSSAEEPVWEQTVCLTSIAINPAITSDANGVHVVWTEYNQQYGGKLYYKRATFKYPVILVHGWRGSPETWRTLRQKLDVEGIKYYIFDYYPGIDNPEEYAVKLKAWVEKLRVDTGYTGKLDIVCHSMGAMVSRWYMEELDSGKNAENIRQWIGSSCEQWGSYSRPCGNTYGFPEYAIVLLSWLP